MRRATPLSRVSRALAALAIGCWSLAAAAQELRLPVRNGSVRFAVLGDTGTGGSAQYEIAQLLARYRVVFPFTFVIMLGDNMYGSEGPRDFERKFERPYKPLIDAKVDFYAALGNHDDSNQRFYKPFNMNGERYFTFSKGRVRFFVLDSNYMDPDQLRWLERELKGSNEPWKVAYFHHPLYSSGGRHGSEVDLRVLLEPLFLEHGLDVVFAGHEHFYERIKPQKGIYHFTAGGSAKLREGDIQKSSLTAAGFDRDRSFMLVEVCGEEMFFQTVSRTAQTVDAGVIRISEDRDTHSSVVERLKPDAAKKGAGDNGIAPAKEASEKDSSAKDASGKGAGEKTEAGKAGAAAAGGSKKDGCG